MKVAVVAVLLLALTFVEVRGQLSAHFGGIPLFNFDLGRGRFLGPGGNGARARAYGNVGGNIGGNFGVGFNANGDTARQHGGYDKYDDNHQGGYTVTLSDILTKIFG